MPSEPLRSSQSGRQDSGAAEFNPRLDLSRRIRPADLPEWMDEPCSREEMRACLHDLALVNRLLFGYRPILHWLEGICDHANLNQFHAAHPLRILDVGCGYGDTLRTIEAWAHRRKLAVELTGIDLNLDTVTIARGASGRQSRIRFACANVFGFQPLRTTHLVLSSLFTHHLEDVEIVRFVRWMEDHALLGWCVNDLSRHPTPYRLFHLFARILRLHPFVRHDGPVSIARAFRREDWQHYCMAAGIPVHAVEIRGFTPGRLCVARRKLG